MISRPPSPGSFYEQAYSDLSHKPREQWPTRIAQLTRAYGRGHDAPEVVRQKLLNLARIIQTGRDRIVSRRAASVGGKRRHSDSGIAKLDAEVRDLLRK
jgi:hypothetical protein